MASALLAVTYWIIIPVPVGPQTPLIELSAAGDAAQGLDGSCRFPCKIRRRLPLLEGLEVGCRGPACPFDEKGHVSGQFLEIRG